MEAERNGETAPWANPQMLPTIPFLDLMRMEECKFGGIKYGRRVRNGGLVLKQANADRTGLLDVVV